MSFGLGLYLSILFPIILPTPGTPVSKPKIPPKILPPYPGFTSPSLGPSVYVSVYPYLLDPRKRFPKNPR